MENSSPFGKPLFSAFVLGAPSFLLCRSAIGLYQKCPQAPFPLRANVSVQPVWIVLAAHYFDFAADPQATVTAAATFEAFAFFDSPSPPLILRYYQHFPQSDTPHKTHQTAVHSDNSTQFFISFRYSKSNEICSG